MFAFIISLPIWLRWVLRVVFIVWAFEAFLAPFKLNVIRNTFKQIEINTEQIKGFVLKIDKDVVNTHNMIYLEHSNKHDVDDERIPSD